MQAEVGHEALVVKAKEGDVDAIEDWLSSLEKDPNSQALLLGPGDRNKIAKVLCSACASSRPGCVRVARLILVSLTAVSVEGLEPAAAESDQSQAESLLGNCLSNASKYGAEETVEAILNCRVQLLTSCRANVDYESSAGFMPLHRAVLANRWDTYADPWSREHARQAMSLGNQNVIRMLLRHGAAVDVISTDSTQRSPLHVAAKFSGFVSLGVMKELLRAGASLDIISGHGRTAEAIARRRLKKPIYTGDGMPDNPHHFRRRGAVEAFLELCAGVRAAGSWKRYANAPRIDVIVLQRLCAAGRASPPPALARLFPTSTKSPPLPKEMVWLILKFWRTDRDP